MPEPPLHLLRRDAGEGVPRPVALEVFLDNVRRRKQPLASLETGHDASNLGHLMNIAWEAGRTIRWDGAKEKIAGDAGADKLVNRPYRAPWKLAV